jgi:endonuclease/exonuclease/phosphatase family metal-dependent hydrolase
MKILTWNVLHRVHAETHSEPAIRRWPDERERVRAVVARVAQALSTEGVEVVLLQEVSGDVLTELRARLPEYSVLNHLYPRVPRQKGASRSVVDPTEHLVVVAPPGAKIVRAHTFSSDPGKGFLMVSLPERLVVASTHVSWGTKGEAQLAMLSQLLRETPSLCIGGDFNAGRQAVTSALDPDVLVSQLPEGSPRTRPQDDAKGGTDIDHLLGRGVQLAQAQVLDHGELSDHRPVAATVTA